MSTDAAAGPGVVYPESDGKPMADNTLQWEWMVKIVGELREQFAGRDVFVAGDLFWYPVEGDAKAVAAPDALVAFGRPPGYRGSYKQWDEGGVAPQVVFEVLSPANTAKEMAAKLRFYDRHGVEEYYLIDPLKETVLATVRQDERLETVYPVDGFVSPRLGVRFETAGGVRLFSPTGREFQAREERVSEIAEELRRTALAFEQERERAIDEFQRAERERARAEQERERAESALRDAEAAKSRAAAEFDRAEQELRVKDAYAAKLRELGIDPASLLRPAG